MKLPEWFLRAIKNDDDRKRGELGLIKSDDRIDVVCENCGITLNNLVKSRLVKRNLENPNYRILCKQCSLRTTNVEVGTKFGDLTVIKEVEQRTNRNNRRKFLCKCICGREVTPFLENLMSGATTSCGKHKNKKIIIQNNIINKENTEVLFDIKKFKGNKKEIVNSKTNCNYANGKDIKQSKFGFLRETSEKAERFGFDKNTGICMTGLEKYLEEIYPDYKWIHDKVLGNIDGVSYKTRPDYRCEEYKLIVEFDGIAHYTSPDQILRDYKNTEIYERLGYKVIRIPYFIQLTNKNVEKIFGVKVYTDLFPVGVPSFSVELKNTPAYLCPLGIERMAREFKLFPDDYKTNIEYLKTIDKNLSGVDALESYYNK